MSSNQTHLPINIFPTFTLLQPPKNPHLHHFIHPKHASFFIWAFWALSHPKQGKPEPSLLLLSLSFFLYYYYPFFIAYYHISFSFISHQNPIFSHSFTPFLLHICRSSIVSDYLIWSCLKRWKSLLWNLHLMVYLGMILGLCWSIRLLCRIIKNCTR